MSTYENVICEKLKLKGKALEVKSGVINKKKKKYKKHNDHYSRSKDGDILHKPNQPIEGEKDGSEQTALSNDYLTPAERRYLQQWEKIDRRRLEKMAIKSHRDRIQEFNQYLANLTEHYDIPKVGPG